MGSWHTIIKHFKRKTKNLVSNFYHEAITKLTFRGLALRHEANFRVLIRRTMSLAAVFRFVTYFPFRGRVA